MHRIVITRGHEERDPKRQALWKLTLALSRFPFDFGGGCGCGGWLGGSFDAGTMRIGIVHHISMAQQKTKHFF